MEVGPSGIGGLLIVDTLMTPGQLQSPNNYRLDPDRHGALPPRLCHAVADARLGEDVPGVVGVVLQLAAKLLDEGA